MGMGNAYSRKKQVSYPIAQVDQPGQFAGYFDLDFSELEEIDQLDLNGIHDQLAAHVAEGNEDLRVDLGVVLSLMGHHQQALHELEMADSKRDKDALYPLGRLLLERKKAPKEEDKNGRRSMFRQENPSVDLGPSWTEVVNLLREAIEHDPRNIPAQYFLGEAIQGLIKEESTKNVVDAFSCYLQEGAPIGHQESVKAFLASQSPETQSQAAFEAGEAAFRKGDYKASRAAFEEAIRLGREDAWYFLGRVFEEEKDFYRAADAFHKAMELDIQFKESRKRRAKAVDRLFRDINLMLWGQGTIPASSKKGSVIKLPPISNPLLSDLMSSLRPHEVDILQLAFSNDGQRLLARDRDGVAKVWDLTKGTSFFDIAQIPSEAEAVAYAPNGELLLILNEDKSAVTLWDAVQGMPLFSLINLPEYEEGASIKACSFSPDSGLVAVASSMGVTVWNARKGEIIQRFTDFEEWDWINTLAFLPDGKSIVCNGSEYTRVLDITIGSVKTLSAYHETTYNLQVSSTGKYIAFADPRTPRVVVWDMEIDKAVEGMPDSIQKKVFVFQFLPDRENEPLLVMGSRAETIQCWNIETKELILEIPVKEGAINCLAVATTPETTLIAVGSSGSAFPKVFDFKTGKLLSTLPFYQPTGKTLTKSNLGMTGGVYPPHW